MSVGRITDSPGKTRIAFKAKCKAVAGYAVNVGKFTVLARDRCLEPLDEFPATDPRLFKAIGEEFSLAASEVGTGDGNRTRSDLAYDGVQGKHSEKRRTAAGQTTHFIALLMNSVRRVS